MFQTTSNLLSKRTEISTRRCVAGEWPQVGHQDGSLCLIKFLDLHGGLDRMRRWLHEYPVILTNLFLITWETIVDQVNYYVDLFVGSEI